MSTPFVPFEPLRQTTFAEIAALHRELVAALSLDAGGAPAAFLGPEGKALEVEEQVDRALEKCFNTKVRNINRTQAKANVTKPVKASRLYDAMIAALPQGDRRAEPRADHSVWRLADRHRPTAHSRA